MQQDLLQKKGIFFTVDKAGFEKIPETALAFEGNERSSSTSEDEEQQESVTNPVIYVRQRRTKGKCCHLVMESLLSD